MPDLCFLERSELFFGGHVLTLLAGELLHCLSQFFCRFTHLSLHILVFFLKRWHSIEVKCIERESCFKGSIYTHLECGKLLVSLAFGSLQGTIGSGELGHPFLSLSLLPLTCAQ